MGYTSVKHKYITHSAVQYYCSDAHSQSVKTKSLLFSLTHALADSQNVKAVCGNNFYFFFCVAVHLRKQTLKLSLAIALTCTVQYIVSKLALLNNFAAVAQRCLYYKQNKHPLRNPA